VPSTPVAIREATPDDLPALARYGTRLAREHHAMDPLRFFVTPAMEEGYAWWLGKELANRDAVVLAAVRFGRAGAERVVGYAYGRIEPRDWNTLREKSGVGVDLYVDARARRAGLGRRLVDELARRLAERGAPRVIISVAEGNPVAQQAFARMGFRRTMVEMAREATAARAVTPAARTRRRSRRATPR
jgi:ribosomal protein S18 acetylase RimI-like enzyme